MRYEKGLLCLLLQQLGGNSCVADKIIDALYSSEVSV